MTRTALPWALSADGDCWTPVEILTTEAVNNMDTERHFVREREE
jgi:hypothetical protein